MVTASKRSSLSEPWERDNPKKKSRTSKPLGAAAKASAKRAAKKAGRPYPNMIDNMNAARKSKAGKS